MRGFYLVVGALSFVLGGIGIALPVLPTVPFWLLSVYCFSRACPALAARLEASPIYQKAVGDSLRRGGLFLAQKVKILSLSTSMMLLAIFLAPSGHLRLLLLALIAIKYYVFFVRIPTLKEVKEG